MPKPNTADAMKRFRAGNAGFTDKAHLKAKGLIPRADGTKKKSPKYEDAPANATGTAVAGTGDDSSTVVVKKKKDKDKMKDRLLRRFKIKETIDRLVPDLEPPKDEVRERADQLKELALKEGAVQKAITIAKRMGGNMTGAVREIEKIAKGLSDEPSVRAALRTANEAIMGNPNLSKFLFMFKNPSSMFGGARQQGKLITAKSKAAATAEFKKMLPKAKIISAKEVDDHSYGYEEVQEKRVAQDKDVKGKPGTQPKKYYKTLSKSEKEKRAAHFAKQKYRKSDDDDDYKPAPGDKGAKTKTSKFTKKFKQMYGEVNQIDEKIKGLENKAKKTGMPYGILKKVYDRGMAAWKGGHRPGTTQQQWAFARVNSFVTKSPGTWGKADSDLAKQVRAK